MQVECVRGYCATNGTCSNHQFQSGISLLLSLDRSRDKGVARLADQAIEEGEFIFQYTGEVIACREYTLHEKVCKRCIGSFYGAWNIR